jgi:hypothetical protein
MSKGLAGFLLAQAISRGSITYQKIDGIFVGIYKFWRAKYQQKGRYGADRHLCEEHQAHGGSRW